MFPAFTTYDKLQTHTYPEIESKPVWVVVGEIGDKE